MRRLCSARYVVEDENGEVIGSADTYEEAETLNGFRIVDTSVSQSMNHRKLSSSVELALIEAEDYFGTVAEGDVVSCQDVITHNEMKVLKDIAERNDVSVKIGKYSARFYDSEGHLEDMINVMD